MFLCLSNNIVMYIFNKPHSLISVLKIAILDHYHIVKSSLAVIM